MVIREAVADKKAGTAESQIAVEIIIPWRFFEMLPDIRVLVQHQLIKHVFLSGATDDAVQMNDRAVRQFSRFFIVEIEARRFVFVL